MKGYRKTSFENRISSRLVVLLPLYNISTTYYCNSGGFPIFRGHGKKNIKRRENVAAEVIIPFTGGFF